MICNEEGEVRKKCSKYRGVVFEQPLTFEKNFEFEILLGFHWHFFHAGD